MLAVRGGDPTWEQRAEQVIALDAVVEVIDHPLGRRPAARPPVQRRNQAASAWSDGDGMTWLGSHRTSALPPCHGADDEVGLCPGGDGRLCFALLAAP
jgi:hypothetical protein